MSDELPDQEFEAFCRASDKEKPYLLIRRVLDDLTTPVAAVLKIGPKTKNLFLLESVKGGETRGRYSVVGMQPDQCFRIVDAKPQIKINDLDYKPIGQTPAKALRSFVEAAKVDVDPGLPPMLSGVFGYLGYDAVGWLDNIPLGAKEDPDTPDAILIRPTLLAVFDSVNQEIILCCRLNPTMADHRKSAWQQAKQRLDDFENTILGPLSAPPIKQQPAPVVEIKPQSNTSKKRFHEMVSTAKEYIIAGDVFQVVLSQRFSTPFSHSPFALYRSLRKSNPSPFLYFLQMDDFSIVGSSPEILVRVRNRKITIRPIAGTRPRGLTTEQDMQFEQDLLADEKELSEHLMLVDLGRNDAARIAKSGSVKVAKSFIIERYSKVMHIVSDIEAELDEEHDALHALFAGFPHGTVSGAPKIRAMQIISELEQSRRGIYAGAVGYFSTNGDLDTCIALRTAIIKDGMMYVQAGGGNVLDSDEETERMETVHKSQALFDAAANAWRFSC